MDSPSKLQRIIAHVEAAMNSKRDQEQPQQANVNALNVLHSRSRVGEGLSPVKAADRLQSSSSASLRSSLAVPTIPTNRPPENSGQLLILQKVPI